jgi:carbamoyltransferase
MIILGINDGHDAGICLLRDDKILYASNEERFTRVKFQSGFPALCLQDALKYAGHIDIIALAGFGSVFFPSDYNVDSHMSFLRNIYSKFAKFSAHPLFVQAHKFASYLQQFRISRQYSIKEICKFYKGRILTFGHHACHASSAYYTSGFCEATVFTLDGGGDGLSGTIWEARYRKMKKIAESPKIHSAGNFWDYITYICGFIPNRHGGKITGLAAYQHSPEVFFKLFKYFDCDYKKMRWNNRNHLFWENAIAVLKKELQGFTREQIAWGAQRLLEMVVMRIVLEGIKKTGIGNIACAGGVFANVKLNQVLMNLPEVKDIFIHPHMGDGGLALGAAYLVNKPLPIKLRDVYLGKEI